jgi:DNA (cytosine-5)-methyltransferase 1
MENVTQVHGKKNKEHFDEWIGFLESKGYRNYWEDLNANDFGIPQNRKRCYMVSVLGYYSFEFPKPIKTNGVIKDFITDFDGPRKVNKTLLPYFGDEWKQQYSSSNGCIKVFDGECQGVFKSDYTNKRIYSMYGICPTITTHNSINISELKGKLNVAEQWKLMGFDEGDYTKVSKTNTPEGELKKQVGNSIVVDVLCHIFSQML